MTHQTTPSALSTSADPSRFVDAEQALAPYLGVCPTCLGWQAEGDDLQEHTEVCPTCGQVSVEWTLSREIDAVLREMRGVEAVERAIREL